jgi:hypothetical protein
VAGGVGAMVIMGMSRPFATVAETSPIFMAPLISAAYIKLSPDKPAAPDHILARGCHF